MRFVKLCMHLLLFCTHYFAWRLFVFAEGDVYKKEKLKVKTDLQKNNRGWIPNVNLRSVSE